MCKLYIVKHFNWLQIILMIEENYVHTCKLYIISRITKVHGYL